MKRGGKGGDGRESSSKDARDKSGRGVTRTLDDGSRGGRPTASSKKQIAENALLCGLAGA